VAHALATQEAKIRRITVQGQPEQIVCKILSQKCPKQKRAGGVAQVVEHLPSRCEVLNSNPKDCQKKKKASSGMMVSVCTPSYSEVEIGGS
jgi:hypothetical protein